MNAPDSVSHIEDLVRDAERALLTSDVRNDAARVRALLHPDFVEIGRSGRRFTRADILVDLVEEAPRATPETDDWDFRRLAPDTVLVTYRLTAGPRVSRHSSIWTIVDGSAAMLFHQGTEANGANGANGAIRS